jgi:hypothetical protein
MVITELHHCYAALWYIVTLIVFSNGYTYSGVAVILIVIYIVV